MSKLRSIYTLFLLYSWWCSFVTAAQGPSRINRGHKWQTLSGNAPLVIARGGFSGIFPDSSFFAYKVAVQTGLHNVHLWCDVQLTKDGAGICFPDIRLENASDIDTIYENRHNSYTVNGVSMHGWFSLDFTLDELAPVNLKQRIFSRAPNFDGTSMQIQIVDDVIGLKPPGLWLNIPNDIFFSQHNLSMKSFIISVSKRATVSYISSPEAGFLRSIISRLKTGPTKLVFQFLGRDDVEPSTKQTYGSFLNNLTFIKTFATGILVPKYYIWPVDNSLYIQNHTSLVLDAHKAGLEVFAYSFMNDDASLPYDYSYDPVAEYLSFIDNGKFSVDGVLSDFPITPSATIDCYSHMGKNETMQAKLLIISSEGASGTYPGCTDKAYEKAVSDSADILDCPVQMTNDGVPICLGSINLRDKTNAAQSEFINLVDEDVRDILNSTILEIKKFATSVVVSKRSVFNTDTLFVIGETNIVSKLQAFNLPVYVQYFQNEFVSQPWDFFSDPYVELNEHVSMGINGVITEYPVYMTPVQPGGLIPLMGPKHMPPPQAPNPILTEKDVVEPPLPPVIERPSTGNGSLAPGPTPRNEQPTLVTSTILNVVAILLALFVLW